MFIKRRDKNSLTLSHMLVLIHEQLKTKSMVVRAFYHLQYFLAKLEIFKKHACPSWSPQKSEFCVQTISNHLPRRL